MSNKAIVVRCPHCKSKVNWEKSQWRPFCSERCRLIDLGDWASEKFKIPGEKINSDQLPDKKEENESSKSSKFKPKTKK